MGYLEKYRIFVPEMRRSLHIAKYRNEQKSARFHIVTYIISANDQLLDFQSKSNLERVSIFNTFYRGSQPYLPPYHMGAVSVLKTDILSIISPRDSKSMKLEHKNGYSLPKLKKSFNLLGSLEKKTYFCCCKLMNVFKKE